MVLKKIDESLKILSKYHTVSQFSLLSGSLEVPSLFCREAALDFRSRILKCQKISASRLSKT